MFSAIDLSQLPAPDVIEALDFEAILAALGADFTARYPDYTAALESDPIVKLLEVAAYRETILRGRINDAARAVLLAYATGADLDQLGAWWGVSRRETDTDASFRARIQLSLEGHTSAGSIGAYTWHALEADPSVADVGVTSPIPGTVRLVVKGDGPDGIASPAALAAVEAACSAEDVRPLCDTVTVQSAAPLRYDVLATLYIESGPAASVVAAAATAAVQAYAAEASRVGGRVARSGIMRALHQPGVLWVDLQSPAGDVVADPLSHPRLNALTIGTDAGAPVVGLRGLPDPTTLPNAAVLQVLLGEWYVQIDAGLAPISAFLSDGLLPDPAQLVDGSTLQVQGSVWVCETEPDVWVPVSTLQRTAGLPSAAGAMDGALLEVVAGLWVVAS